MNLPIQKSQDGKRHILMFNASLYKSSSCLRKVWYTLFRGLTKDSKDFKMAFGTATHKFLQAHYEGKDFEQGLKLAVDYYANIYVPDGDFRHAGYLASVCMQYKDFYKNGGDMLRVVDSVKTLECSFAYPFYQTANVEVLLCGTIDMIAIMGGRKVIVDHKTTSVTQVDTYLNSYQLSPQLMVYKYIYQKLFKGEDVGCLINGIFLSKTGKTKFQRSMIFEYTPNQLEILQHHLIQTVEHIVSNFEAALNLWEKNPDYRIMQLFTPNYTCCDEKFGMCQFAPVCMTDSDEDKESIISNEFVTKIYNPLKFSE